MQPAWRPGCATTSRQGPTTLRSTFPLDPISHRSASWQRSPATSSGENEPDGPTSIGGGRRARGPRRTALGLCVGQRGPIGLRRLLRPLGVCLRPCPPPPPPPDSRPPLPRRPLAPGLPLHLLR